MKKEELKQVIKECVRSVVNEMDTYEPYDPETDTMAPGPRDRTEPSAGPDKLTQAIHKLNGVASLLRTMSKVCEKHNLPNLAKQANDSYYDIIKFTQSGLKEGMEEMGEQPPVEPPVEEPQVDKNKIKMVNDILVTCGNMQKRIHSLTDRVIINGIRNIQDKCIELMKSLGAK